MNKKTSKKKQVKNLNRDLERQNALIIELTNTRNRAIEQLGYQADRLYMQNVLIDLLIDDIIKYSNKDTSGKEELLEDYKKKAQKIYLEQNGGTPDGKTQEKQANAN